MQETKKSINIFTSLCWLYLFGYVSVQLSKHFSGNIQNIWVCNDLRGTPFDPLWFICMYCRENYTYFICQDYRRNLTLNSWDVRGISLPNQNQERSAPTGSDPGWDWEVLDSDPPSPPKNGFVSVRSSLNIWQYESSKYLKIRGYWTIAAAENKMADLRHFQIW